MRDDDDDWSVIVSMIRVAGGLSVVMSGVQCVSHVSMFSDGNDLTVGWQK